MKRIAVYGSLKRGCYNFSHFLEEGDYVETIHVKGFLKDLGAYPALVQGDDAPEVEVEVFEVTPYTLESINGMEVGAGYYPAKVPTSEGYATIWYMPPFDIEGVRSVLPDEDGVVRWRE